MSRVFGTERRPTYVCRRCGIPCVWFFRWKHVTRTACPSPEPIERGGGRR